MKLSTLIQKGGLAEVMTATPATLATQEANQPVTVAEVATVAVASTSEAQIEQVIQFPCPELSAGEESRVLAWLAHIGESDPEGIAVVLEQCRSDLEARRYFLQRAEEVPRVVASNDYVTCGNCTHFERIDHPNLGHCAKGEPEAYAGLWDTDRRYCEMYSPKKDPACH